MVLASPDAPCYLSAMRKTIPDRLRSQLETRSIVAGLLILSAVLFTGCVSGSEDPDRILTADHYTNKIIGFDFAFPATWQAKLDQKIPNINNNMDVVATFTDGAGSFPTNAEIAAIKASFHIIPR
jgi:hypothetical protein